MLYFASFFCPRHPEKNQFFDENRKQPCLGKCGHTVCLSCVKNSVNCPICNREDVFTDRTINYGAMKIMSDCRSNILNMFKSWWAGEKYGSGLCSKCFTQTEFLRICLLCDSHLCFIDKYGAAKLFVLYREDLLKLSQCVVCADCALEYHNHPGQADSEEIVKIEKIKVDSDARRITSQIIMHLLKDEVKKGNLRLNCKLRFMKLQEVTLVLSMVLKELDGFEEGDCGYLGELIKGQLANKYIENTWTEVDQAFNGPVCECTRVYDELLKIIGKEEAKYRYKGMSVPSEYEFAMGCSLNFKENSEWRGLIYSYLRETPPNIEYTKPINTEGGCELCIYHDYFDEAIDRNTEYYRSHCMEIYEHYFLYFSLPWKPMKKISKIHTEFFLSFPSIMAFFALVLPLIIKSSVVKDFEIIYVKKLKIQQFLSSGPCFPEINSSVI